MCSLTVDIYKSLGNLHQSREAILLVTLYWAYNDKSDAKITAKHAYLSQIFILASHMLLFSACTISMCQ